MALSHHRVNILEEKGLDAASPAERIAELEKTVEADSHSSRILLLDSQGNRYDSRGGHGVWSDLDVLSGGGEQYTYISDSFAYETLLLFLIPTEFVAADTVEMVNTVLQTALALAAVLLVLMVLAVDDEEVICENIRLTMEDTGVDVDYALDGYSAMEALRRAGEVGQPYDIVLPDWKMPGLDGVETARNIRQTIDKEIPIIVLTATRRHGGSGSCPIRQPHRSPSSP